MQKMSIQRNIIKRNHNQEYEENNIFGKKQKILTEYDNSNSNMNPNQSSIDSYDNNMSIVRNSNQINWNIENLENLNAMSMDVVDMSDNYYIKINKDTQQSVLLPSKHKGRTISDYCTIPHDVNKPYNTMETSCQSKMMISSDIINIIQNKNIYHPNLLKCNGCNVQGDSMEFLRQCNFCDRHYCILKCLGHCESCDGVFCIHTCSTLNYNSNNYVISLCLDCCRNRL